jgi:hypothetical protein
MNLTQEQCEAMFEAAKPLIRWMKENCNPHCEARVDSRSVELLEGVARSEWASEKDDSARPVLVDGSVCANHANKKYGDRYGIDWLYRNA